MKFLKLGCLKKKKKWLKAYFFQGAGAGAGEKNTRSRSKVDRLRNTANYTIDALTCPISASKI